MAVFPVQIFLMHDGYYIEANIEAEDLEHAELIARTMDNEGQLERHAITADMLDDPI